MTVQNGLSVELEHYEEMFGEEPNTQRIPKSKKPKGEGSSNSKKNKIDKKNAVKAPWKDFAPSAPTTDRD